MKLRVTKAVPNMNRFFLLDRDGILNQDTGYIFETEKIILPEYIIEILHFIQSKGFRLVVITNQSGIARGYFTVTQLQTFHKYLQKLYKEYGIFLEDFFYCPHLPQITGECLCRKPKSLLVEKAIAKYKIDVKNSYMMGDGPRDVQAGKRAGLKTILIHSQPDDYADFWYTSLKSFYLDIKSCIV